MSNTVYTAVAVALSAILTLLIRALPFLLFGGKKEVPASIQYLGKVLPMAVMGTLVVYCLKGINLIVTPYGIPEIVSALVVILLHLWKRNVFLSIAAGTACYMIFIQLIFP